MRNRLFAMMHQGPRPLCRNRKRHALIMAMSFALSSGAPAAAATGDDPIPGEATKTGKASTEETKTTTVASEQPQSKLPSAGTLELEEYKKIQPIEVNASQSKLFLIKNKIVRTSIADPGIAEPVVLAENVLVLLGKAPGETTLEIWDDMGGEVHMDVIVNHNSGPLHSLFLETPTSLFEFLRRQRSKRSKEFISRGKLEIKECADPRESKDNIYLGQIAEGLLALSNAVAKPITTYTALAPRTQPAGKKATAKRPIFKPTVDTLSVPGGQTIVITSGFKTNKTTRTLDLFASQSRTFKTKQNLAKLTTTDPAIAEPIAISKNEFVLLGKVPGRTTFEIQDIFGNALATDLNVKKQHGRLLSTLMSFGTIFTKSLNSQRHTAPIPTVVVNELELCEQIPTETITLKPNQPKFFTSSHSLVRTSLADPGHVEKVMLSANQLALIGKRPGRTTVFLWDDAGNLGALNLLVTRDAAPEQAAQKSNKAQSPQHVTPTQKGSGDNVSSPSDSTESSSRLECEIWTGSKKNIVSLVIGDSGSNQDWVNSTSDFSDTASLITLNNEAVIAINATDYARAIKLLEKALKWSPTYKTARINLAIAYNNFGLTLQNKPAEAISYFHRAIYLDASNDTTKGNLEGIIRKLGKNPDSFNDRVALADDALLKNDTRGGIVEYEAALRLKEDQALRAKLSEAIKALEKSTKIGTSD
jgi:Flp pilus assembly secretin CpaC